MGNELFYIDKDGKKQDASLHDTETLSPDAIREASYRYKKRYNLTEEQRKVLYDR